MAATAKKKTKKKKPSRARSSANGKVKLPVSFGSVSCKKKTVSIPLTVDRDQLTLNEADKLFCERRMNLSIIASGEGDQRDQARLAGMEEDIEVEGSADSHGFSVKSHAIGFTISFNSKQLREAAKSSGVDLADFAGREGYIAIDSTEDIPEPEKTVTVEDDSDETKGEDAE